MRRLPRAAFFVLFATLAAGVAPGPSARAQDEPADAEPRDQDLEPAVSGEALDAVAKPRTAPTRQDAEAPAADELDLGRTEITGNQELPKVLYIVPWQKSDPGNLLGRPVNTLIDEVLAPLDREEFIRQVDYYSDLNEPQEE